MSTNIPMDFTIFVLDIGDLYLGNNNMMIDVSYPPT